MQIKRENILAIIMQLSASVLSAVLLYVSFPPVAEAHGAWMAFVPLLLLARFAVPYRSFKLGYLSGLIFWMLSLSWLISLSRTATNIFVAVLGWLALSVYAAFYTALFALICSFLLHFEDTIAAGESRKTKIIFWRLFLILLIPAVWVGLEYIRSSVFTGFPWNQLGVSQYENIAVIQLAEWGGVYAVSALIMVMNTALALTGVRLGDVFRRREQVSKLRYELMLGLLICALCWMHGTRIVLRARQRTSEGPEIRVAVVQPNTPQIKKWNLNYEMEIFDRLHKQTQLASIGRPDLIVWPETAVMRPYNLDDMTQAFVKNHAQLGSPILVGAMEKVNAVQSGNEYTDWEFYNSSFCIGVDGEIQGIYRKQHLVPFGEYIPLEDVFPFIKRAVPLGFSCSVGKESTLMYVVPVSQNDKIAFSVLICFEDIFAVLSRHAVRKGARFLVNQTNDAWFDGTAAHLQHMSHCVFRAVENRIPIARSANTGVSCFITKYGSVSYRESPEDPYGLSVEGFKRSGITPRNPDESFTVYTKFGDYVLAIPCAILVIGICGYLAYTVALEHKRRKKK